GGRTRGGRWNRLLRFERAGVPVQPGAVGRVPAGGRRAGDVQRRTATGADRVRDDVVRPADSGGGVLRAGAAVAAAGCLATVRHSVQLVRVDSAGPGVSGYVAVERGDQPRAERGRGEY